ncbi:MAG TPA: transporter substrate-binding domain-containing protein [Caldimonas sp.]|jgi:polar amino acid transport system substrate-binding protein|nr:transporter substrate-binding domain-containing protein [Caldimonas sp.]
MFDRDSKRQPLTNAEPARRRFLKEVGAATGGAAAALALPAAAAECPKSAADTVKETGVLKAGVTKEVPYFGFIDERGNHVGFECDLVAEIAKRLNVKLNMTQVTSATRIPTLQQGRIDLVASTMTHYRSRDAVVDFSIAYFYSPQTLLVKTNSGIHKVADLSGKRVGAVIGSGTVKYFKEAVPKATIQTFEGQGESFLALEQGLVDALATDTVILAGLRGGAKNPRDYVVLGKEGIYGGGPYGLGVRENDSKWRDSINFTLQDIWNDGTWDKLFDKWVGPNTKLQLTKELLGFEMETWH